MGRASRRWRRLGKPRRLAKADCDCMDPLVPAKAGILAHTYDIATSALDFRLRRTERSWFDANGIHFKIARRSLCVHVLDTRRPEADRKIP